MTSGGGPPVSLLVVLVLVGLVAAILAIRHRGEQAASARRSVSIPWIRRQLGEIGLSPVSVGAARAVFEVSRLHLPSDVADQVAAALGWSSAEVTRTGSRLVATRTG